MALVGAILGDIAGSQYEFNRMRPIDLDWKNCELFTNKCRRTDDSLMSIATKVGVLDLANKKEEKKDFTPYYQSMGVLYPNAGYGGMFHRWLFTPNPEPYHSFGNGSAMRVSFVGDYFEEEKDIINWAKLSAECTHNHPEGVKGAVVTAMCIHLAKLGRTKEEILNYCNHFYPAEKYKYSSEIPLDELRKIYKWDVTCQGSVPAAIRCFYESDSYEGFLRNVFSLKCDMDTLCAIGGGVAEEFYHGTGLDNETLLRTYLDDFLYEKVMEDYKKC